MNKLNILGIIVVAILIALQLFSLRMVHNIQTDKENAAERTIDSLSRKIDSIKVEHYNRLYNDSIERRKNDSLLIVKLNKNENKIDSLLSLPDSVKYEYASTIIDKYYRRR